MSETHERPVVRALGTGPEPRRAAMLGSVGSSVCGDAANGAPGAPFAVSGTAKGPHLGEECSVESDVFVCRRQASGLDVAASLANEQTEASRLAEKAAAEGVTLFVYGWENVQPGPLSWAFPSLRAALHAARAMRNAVAWSIAAGSEWASIDAARAGGAVMVEQSA